MSANGQIEIYLSFDGSCRDALEFYKTLFNGEITYYQEWKDAPESEGESMDDMPDIVPDEVMHASLKIGDTTVMASDNPYRSTVFGDSVTLTWSHPDENEVRRVWEAFVGAGATVHMGLEATFFASLFGSLTDHFGISWQIMHWSEAGENAG
ncbi:MAG TPA: VOC family protein [Clostridiaceae bacterium]|nr:VOC family protein [Clostridiaceae bacterium]